MCHLCDKIVASRLFKGLWKKQTYMSGHPVGCCVCSCCGWECALDEPPPSATVSVTWPSMKGEGNERSVSQVLVSLRVVAVFSLCSKCCKGPTLAGLCLEPICRSVGECASTQGGFWVRTLCWWGAFGGTWCDFAHREYCGNGTRGACRPRSLGVVWLCWRGNQ